MDMKALGGAILMAPVAPSHFFQSRFRSNHFTLRAKAFHKGKILESIPQYSRLCNYAA